MKKILILTFTVLSIGACKSRKPATTEGMTELSSPFSADKYQSNRRFFRASGSGESVNLETAKSQALLLAKQRLASSVQTQIKSVQEAYSSDRKAEGGTEFEQRFQNLTREVLNQIIVDVATIDQKTFMKTDRSYQVHVAIESRKKMVYRKLKEIVKQKTTLSDKDKEYIEKMMDKAIEETGDKD